MNRSRYIPRDFDGDTEFVQSLNDHIAAIREFGGEIYIGTDRVPVDKDGTLLPRNEKGAAFVTAGYVLGFTEKTRIKNAPEEPDEAFGATAPPEIETNGSTPHDDQPVAERDEALLDQEA